MSIVTDLQFNASSIKRLVYLILVTATAFLIHYNFNTPQSHWLIWSALFLSLITLGDTFKRRVTLILITGLTAAFSAFIATSLTPLTLVLMLYIFIITVICVYVSQVYPSYFFSAVIVNLFTVLSSAADISFAENINRFLFICDGTIIALVYQVIFYPYFIQNEIHASFVMALDSLKKLNKHIFSCLLDAEYADNIYLYERRVHASKNRFMLIIERLREMSQIAEKKMSLTDHIKHQERLAQLDLLFDNILDYSQVRRRVTDHSTFSVCSQELKEIYLEINKAIDSVIARLNHKKIYSSTDNLARKITQLENSYNHVLQIASREPLAFLLFLDSLLAFKENIDRFNALPAVVTTSFS